MNNTRLEQGELEERSAEPKILGLMRDWMPNLEKIEALRGVQTENCIVLVILQG